MSEEKRVTLSGLLFEQRTLSEMLMESGGEIDSEIEKRIEALEIDLPVKIDRVAFMLEALDDAESRLLDYKAQVDQGIKSAKKTSERLKERVKTLMIQNSVKTLEGESKKLSLSKLKSKLILNEDFEEKHPDFLKEKVVYKVDKEQVRQYIESGLTLDGAELIENYALKKGLKK